MAQKGTGLETMYPLAIVDDVLEKVGMPKTRPLFNALSPENILGKKLGLTAPGDLLERIVGDVDTKLPSGGGLPRPPGFR